MPPLVFTPNTHLKKPFIPVKRLDISDFKNDVELNTFIHEHCVKQGRPLVLTKLDSLPGWNKDLFDLKRTLEIYGEEGIEIQALGSIEEKKIVPLAAYADMLRTQGKMPCSGNSTVSPLSVSAPESSSTGSTRSPITPASPNRLQIKPEPISDEMLVDDSACMETKCSTLPSIDDTHDAPNASVASIEQQGEDDTSATTDDVYTGIGERIQTGARRRKCNSNRLSSALPVSKKLKYESNNDSDDDDDDDDNDNKNNKNNDGYDAEHQQVNMKYFYAKDIDTPDEYKDCLPSILPPDLLPLGHGDLIRTLPSSLQAVNLMCYLGGDRTGTALHRDISGAVGHNIMTFAEDDAYAQWLVIEKPETPKLRELCQEDFGGGDIKKQVKKSYFLECERAWVSPSQLAARGIVTHVILQKPGDMVIIPSLCYHQVTNVGISFKMAWNRITAHSLLEGIKIQLPLYNIISRPELYRCKATVYFALKDILSNMPTPSTLPSTKQQEIFLEQCRALLHLLAHDMILPEIIEPIAIENVSNAGIIQDDSPGDDDIGFDVVCDFCFADVFHRYYHCGVCDVDLCLQCYVSGRSCAHLDELCMHEPSTSVVPTNGSQKNDMDKYITLYDELVFELNRTFGPLSIIPEFTTFQHFGDCYSLATTCRRIEMYRKNNKYLSNKLHCSHCERVFDLWDARWDIKTIFQHRPCYKSLSYSLNSTVFVCFSCAKKCLACSPAICLSRLDTELIYFRDMSKNLQLLGGSVDRGLFQSAFWPDYKAKINTGDTQALSNLRNRQWSYPEDFISLAAAELIKNITPEGWKCWAKNERIGNDGISMTALIQQLAQHWTDGYKKKLQRKPILSDKISYPYDPKTSNDTKEYAKYITTTDLAFKIPFIVPLGEITENRGRPRKYPRPDEEGYKPGPKPAARTRKSNIAW